MYEQIVVSGEKKKIKRYVLCLGFCDNEKALEKENEKVLKYIRQHDLWIISYEEWWLVQSIHNNNGYKSDWDLIAMRNFLL